MRTLLLAVLWLAALMPAAAAHEVRPAYLELRQTSADTCDVLWKVPGRGGDLRLALYVELPEGTQNLSEPRSRLAGGSFIERWSIRRPGGLAGGTVHVAGLSATLTDVLVRFERLDGTVQVTRLTPSDTSCVLEAAPRTLQVAATYLQLGIEHILSGVDHLLYILAMLILVRGWRRILFTMTAFTLTHSLTLTGAALGWVHVPQPPVEACIALSILFVASEIVRSRQGRPGITERWPWVVSFTFGLLHGFGFAGALSEVGLPAGDIPVALLLFNLGVEIGQLLFIAGVFAVAVSVRRLARGTAWKRVAWSWRLAPYAIGSVSAFWLIQRIAAF